MHFLRYLSLALVAGALSSGALRSDQRVEPLPDLLIGYTEFRTDLPGGRYVNVATRRAVVVKADGTGRRVLAEELTREAGASTQFVGWSPDGKSARLSRDWKSEEVGKWEEEHKDFRTTGDGVGHDIYLSLLPGCRLMDIGPLAISWERSDGISLLRGGPAARRMVDRLDRGSARR